MTEKWDRNRQFVERVKDTREYRGRERQREREREREKKDEQRKNEESLLMTLKSVANPVELGIKNGLKLEQNMSCTWNINKRRQNPVTTRPRKRLEINSKNHAIWRMLKQPVLNLLVLHLSVFCNRPNRRCCDPQSSCFVKNLHFYKFCYIFCTYLFVL